MSDKLENKNTEEDLDLSLDETNLDALDLSDVDVEKQEAFSPKTSEENESLDDINLFDLPDASPLSWDDDDTSFVLNEDNLGDPLLDTGDVAFPEKTLEAESPETEKEEDILNLENEDISLPQIEESDLLGSQDEPENQEDLSLENIEPVSVPEVPEEEQSQAPEEESEEEVLALEGEDISLPEIEIEENNQENIQESNTDSLSSQPQEDVLDLEAENMNVNLSDVSDDTQVIEPEIVPEEADLKLEEVEELPNPEEETISNHDTVWNMADEDNPDAFLDAPLNVSEKELPEELKEENLLNAEDVSLSEITEDKTEEEEAFFLKEEDIVAQRQGQNISTADEQKTDAEKAEETTNTKITEEDLYLEKAPQERNLSEEGRKFPSLSKNLLGNFFRKKEEKEISEEPQDTKEENVEENNLPQEEILESVEKEASSESLAEEENLPEIQDDYENSVNQETDSAQEKTSSFETNEKQHYQNVRWYSGKIDDSYFEFSKDYESGEFEGTSTLNSIHVNVGHSSYGWNVHFANGMNMSLQDLREYQLRYGALPDKDGRLSYGETTLDFKDVEKIVYYESPIYFSYGVLDN